MWFTHPLCHWTSTVLLGTLLSAGLALAGTSPPVSGEVAARFLKQASWAATPAQIARVKQIGLEAYIDEQFNTAPTPIADAPVDATNLRPLQSQFFLNAIQGNDQLRQRVAWALMQIWVVSGNKLDQPVQVAPYLRLLQADAFSTYDKIMYDVTLSPAMGRYLDMVNNDKAPVNSTRTPNENYARELLQLFTLGTELLRTNAATQNDSTGTPLPSYDQALVENLARVMTGWTYAPPDGVAPKSHNPSRWDLPMVAWEPNHDTGSKTLFNGKVIPAGQTANQDLKDALQNIFLHQNVAPFICKQLIQHLVSSNPSGTYVRRVVEVFNNNGQGVRGDMKAVVKAILLDPEARYGDYPQVPLSFAGHLQEPVLYLVGILRGLNATVDGTHTLMDRTNALSQNVFYSPSVFNYFSPSYRIPGQTSLAPEFQIYSPANAMTRADLVNTIVYGKLTGVTIDYTSYAALAGSNPSGLLDLLNTNFLGGQMPAQMRQTILTAMAAQTSNLAKAQAALYLVLTSAPYLIHS